MYVQCAVYIGVYIHCIHVCVHACTKCIIMYCICALANHAFPPSFPPSPFFVPSSPSFIAAFLSFSLFFLSLSLSIPYCLYFFKPLLLVFCTHIHTSCDSRGLSRPNQLSRQPSLSLMTYWACWTRRTSLSWQVSSCGWELVPLTMFHFLPCGKKTPEIWKW